MAAFHLQIVTMDGMIFDGQVQSVSCRTVHGDLAILARHMNYCTAIGMGTAHVVMDDGTQRSAACIGGMLTVMNGQCRLIPTTWEWSDEIDVERARQAKARAEEKMNQSGLSGMEHQMAEAKLHRALVRIGAVGKNE